VQEHGEMFERLAAGDGDSAAALCEKHVRGFDDVMNQAVRKRLGSPLPK